MPEYIVIHDSDSPYGNAFIIDSWHATRGFLYEHKASGTPIHVGYHFLVLNGHYYGSQEYIEDTDGQVIRCRPENVDGAHCYSKDGNPLNDLNEKSLAVCFIGNELLTSKQLASGIALVSKLQKKYGIATEKVVGHKEMDTINKKDPRIDMQSFRFMLNQVHNG